MAQLRSVGALSPRALEQQPAAGEATPCWFGGVGEELFGFYHSPRREVRSRKLAIVLCNPFGYEAMCAHRPYRRLAEQLAEHGFPTLRFDYHGTGSSTGSDRDPRRLEAWIDSVRVAVDQVRQLSGCARVALFGARLGATLAVLAAENRPEVSALMLWGPSFSGSNFLREELAVHKLRALRANASVVAAPITERDIEALGFVITAETARSLKALSLSGLGAAPPRVLVLARDTPLQEPRVAAKLAELGTQVHSEAGPGYPEMIDHSRAPAGVWDRLLAFCEAHEAELPAEMPASRHSIALLPARARVWSSADGTTEVHETPMFFGPDQRLFGVLTQGSAQAITSGGPAPLVLLLSGGVNPQVGTNRMHTAWARQWAASGITSFRFDLSGIGDSRSVDGSPDSALYSIGTVGDVRAAMDHLEFACGTQRFVLIGLCSGAFAAFHTALVDTRVDSVALLNLLRFYWSAEDTVERVQAERRRQMRPLRYYVSALRFPATWHKLARGSVNLQGIVKHMALRAGRRARASASYWTSRIGFDGPASSPLASDFRVLSRRGVKSLVIYDGHEPMLDDFHDLLGSDLPRLRARRTLELEVIDGADHIFSPVGSQNVLAALLTRHVHARVLGQTEPE